MAFEAQVLQRHEEAFGAVNQVRSLGGFRLLIVDAVSLSVHGNTRREKTKLWIRNLPPTKEPTLLVSHIPLWRPVTARIPSSQCRRGLKEHTYYDFENSLPASHSKELLENLRPELILSGDDHHSCAVRHKWHSGLPVEELTIPTLSWMQGNPTPGYGLLTLNNGKYGFALCHTPAQIYLLLLYGVYIIAVVVRIVHTVYSRPISLLSGHVEKTGCRSWSVVFEAVWEVILFVGSAFVLLILIRWLSILWAYRP